MGQVARRSSHLWMQASWKAWRQGSTATRCPPLNSSWQMAHSSSPPSPLDALPSAYSASSERQHASPQLLSC